MDTGKHAHSQAHSGMHENTFVGQALFSSVRALDPEDGGANVITYTNLIKCVCLCVCVCLGVCACACWKRERKRVLFNAASSHGEMYLPRVFFCLFPKGRRLGPYAYIDAPCTVLSAHTHTLSLSLHRDDVFEDHGDHL